MRPVAQSTIEVSKFWTIQGLGGRWRIPPLLGQQMKHAHVGDSSMIGLSAQSPWNG
jgi:hypothetical protein